MNFAFQREPAIKAIVALVGVLALAAQLGVLSLRAEATPLEPSQEILDVMPESPLLAGSSAAPERVAEWLVEAVAQVESGGNPSKIGRSGERGIMQIKRATWIQTTRHVFGHAVHFDRAFDPSLSRRVGRAYLAEMSGFLRQYQHDWRSDERSLLLACYNAGPERVLRSHFDLRRLPATTQSYIARATALHDYYLASETAQAQSVVSVEDGSKARSTLGS